mmetsp:Transcript_122896/g.393702  ORF Transcript_122896/g.393702 Transcript_122896/m.393702 type:complete len:240 (+) Transcript_122896:83-802(+)
MLVPSSAARRCRGGVRNAAGLPQCLQSSSRGQLNALPGLGLRELDTLSRLLHGLRDGVDGPGVGGLTSLPRSVDVLLPPLLGLRDLQLCAALSLPHPGRGLVLHAPRTQLRLLQQGVHLHDPPFRRLLNLTRPLLGMRHPRFRCRAFLRDELLAAPLRLLRPLLCTLRAHLRRVHVLPGLLHLPPGLGLGDLHLHPRPLPLHHRVRLGVPRPVLGSAHAGRELLLQELQLVLAPLLGLL